MNRQWRGRRVYLRPLTHADDDALFALYGDAETTKYLSFFPKLRHECIDIIDASIREMATPSPSAFMFAIRETGTQTFVGLVRIGIIGDGEGEIGIAVLPSHRRKGMAREGAQLALSFAFSELRLTSVRARRHEANEASRSWERSVGFGEEVRLAADIVKGGRAEDRLMSRLTRETFMHEIDGPSLNP